MRLEEFYFEGEEKLDIHVYKWSPNKDKKIKAIVQISHGMAETAIRYERLAKKLTDNGYIVYINDHRGHGKTAGNIENLGILATVNDGFTYLVKDMYTLTQIIKKENKGLPLYLFGHSMGSFASQKYIMEYKDELDGLILSGSNGNQGIKLKGAEFFINLEIKKYGREYRSEKIEKLLFGGHNKKFKNGNTHIDWLSRDEKEVEKYIKDPYCGSLSTVGFFLDFVKGLQEVESKENLAKVPKDLPIYIISGDMDPVGNYGKGVIKLEERYKSLGVKDVTCKLYKGGRHEMLNETNKDEVIYDIIKWLDKEYIKLVQK